MKRMLLTLFATILVSAPLAIQAQTDPPAEITKAAPEKAPASRTSSDAHAADVSSGLRQRGPLSPIGAEGVVAEAIEGEELNVHVSGGSASPQDMSGYADDNWSGNRQLWWRGARPGDVMSIELDALRDIDTLELALTCANDYGIIAIRLDGKPLSKPIDLYETKVVTTGVLSLKTDGLKRGKHLLEFEIVGTNPEARQSFMFGLDYLRFRAAGQVFADTTAGSVPQLADGRRLNLDFETGTLEDWTATGTAFDGQPVTGDLVAARRQDSSSRHHGQHWIGGYEITGDDAVGTLTSAAFPVTHRFVTVHESVSAFMQL